MGQTQGKQGDIEDLTACSCGNSLCQPLNPKLAKQGIKPYDVHFLVCTPSGQRQHIEPSWKDHSKIEEEEDSIASWVHKTAKAQPEGKLRHFVTACTLPSTGPEGTVDLVVFPNKIVYTVDPVNGATAVGDIVKAHLKGEVATELAPRPLTSPRVMVLVCTHGKRDARCGRIGAQVYYGILNLLNDRGISSSDMTVVEASHIGGHKFASVAVVYPFAHWYGMLTPKDAERVIDGYLNGDPETIEVPHMLRDKLRGTMAHPQLMIDSDEDEKDEGKEGKRDKEGKGDKEGKEGKEGKRDKTEGKDEKEEGSDGKIKEAD